MNDLTGIITVIEPTAVISEKFSKRTVIVDTADLTDNYPNPINLELHQEAVTDIDGYSVGDKVKVLYHLNGRKWTDPQGVDKYFSTLKIASLEKLGAEQQQPQQPQQAAAKPAFVPPPMPERTAGGVEDSEIPFSQLGDFDQ